MVKLKHILVVAIASILMYSCNNGNSLANFDHVGQAKIDNDTLVKYLSNHYYDIDKDSIKPMVTGKTSLLDDPKLHTQDITEYVNGQDIDYKLYYYIVEQGTPVPAKSSPKITDSILTTYQGRYLTNTIKPVVFETQKLASWLTLDVVVRGWTHGFTHFKGGENITNNGPITYKNFGRGYIIFPSGLGYQNRVNGQIPANSPLIFKISLLDLVENTDHDNDGLPSYLEIVDAAVQADVRRIDTDNDNIANYLDNDDDGDGILTKYEDKNGDGDPRNDFSDPNNPTIPDYLNKKIKVKH